MVNFDLNKLKSLSEDEQDAAWYKADKVLQAASPDELRPALLVVCNAAVVLSLGSDRPSTVSDLAVYDLAAKLVEAYQGRAKTPTGHPDKRYKEGFK